MKQELEKPERSRQGSEVRLAGPRSFAGGWTGWLLGRLRAARRAPPRLAVLDRIALAPRQSLALVEAQGRRFLVATLPEGTPAFIPLTDPAQIGSTSSLRGALRRAGRGRLRLALGLSRCPARREGFVVTVWGAARVAVQAGAPLLPDLAQRLRPSDSTPWTILFVLTLITLLPAVLMAMTPLVRLLVVFRFLRQALGTQTAPSNPTLMGLALMMTWFLMTPVLNQVDQQAVEPYRNGQVTGWEAIDRGARPVKIFLLRYAREKDLALFTAAGQVPRPNTPEDLPMRVVVPAYILSELKAGFSIGAVLYLPFLLIDMVTASVTTSIGMFQLPPVVDFTPSKILFS